MFIDHFNTLNPDFKHFGSHRKVFRPPWFLRLSRHAFALGRIFLTEAVRAASQGLADSDYTCSDAV